MKRRLVNLIVLVSVGLALTACSQAMHVEGGVPEDQPHGLTGVDGGRPEYRWETKHVETPRGRRIMYERVPVE